MNLINNAVVACNVHVWLKYKLIMLDQMYYFFKNINWFNLYIMLTGVFF